MARINIIKPGLNKKEVIIDGVAVNLNTYFSELDFTALQPKETAVVLALGNEDLLKQALPYEVEKDIDKAGFISNFMRLSMNTVAENGIAADKAHVFQDAEFLITFYKLNPTLFNKVFTANSFQTLIASIANYDINHFTRLTPEQKSAFFDAATLMNCDREYLASLMYVDNKVASLLILESYAVVDLLYYIINSEYFTSEHTGITIREQKYYLVNEFPSKFSDLQRLLIYELSLKKDFLKKEIFCNQRGYEVLAVLNSIASHSDVTASGILDIFLLHKEESNYASILRDLIAEFKTTFSD